MAATSILSTDDEMNSMAGENIDVTGWTDANKTAWGLQAEAFVSAISRYDWSTNVATIDGTTAEMLSEYVARYTALSGILYNMGGFSSRIEAEDMINVHVFRMRQIEKLLVDQKTVTYMS